MQLRHWMPATDCPHESGGEYDEQGIIPGQWGIQERYIPLQVALVWQKVSLLPYPLTWLDSTLSRAVAHAFAPSSFPEHSRFRRKTSIPVQEQYGSKAGHVLA